MRSWATIDKKILIHFVENVESTFTEYIQSNSHDPESGGILLGTVHRSNLLISLATTPYAWDKQSRYLFDRHPFIHRLVAYIYWIKSMGKIRYLGEWHTHPEDHPKPSSVDRAGWKNLAENRNDKRPLLVVIVGRKELYVELISYDGINLRMSSIE